MRLTVGPLPPSVYWRRRAIVLGGAILVVFLVAQACLGANAVPGAGSPGPPPSSPPTSGPAAVGQTGPTPASSPPVNGAPATGGAPVGAGGPPDGEDCADDEMMIVADADRVEFTAPDPVQFTIVIRNGSTRACWRDIGGDLRELYLIQGTGASKVWSSRACGAPRGSERVRLEPGFETSYFLVWNGRASDICNGDQSGGLVVAAGDYQLFARLGTAYSEPLGLTIG